MKINVPSRYEDTFSGVKIKVSDMQCEDLVVGAMAAVYEAPRSLAFRFDGIEASCEGDYDWKYESWVGNIKGDGKLRASIHRTSAAFTVTINADDWGAPTELVTADCAMDLAVDDVDVRGDPVGDAANLFVDSFTDWFLEDIEGFVCDSLEEYVYANVGSLLKDAGLQNCECCDRDDGVAPFDDDAMDAAPRDAWVDWHGFFANASGPGARAARDVNAARNFDLLAERDAPSRGDDDDGAAASDGDAWNGTEATYVYVRSSTQRTDECLEVDAFGSALCVFVRGRVDDLPVLASYADAVAPGAALRCLSLSGAAYVVADCETAGSLDAAGAEDALSYAAGMESALVEFFLEDLTDETTGRLCWTVDRGSAAAADDGGALYATTAVCDAFFDDLGNASRANATDLLWSFAALGGATPADYYETHAAGDDDWDWRWEAVEHAAPGSAPRPIGSTAPGATLQLYDCNGGTAQTFSVVEYFEKVDKRLGVSGPDMFANAKSTGRRNRRGARAGPLAAIPRDRLRAYARTDGATDDAAALGLGLPADAAFHAETTMSVRFAFGDLGEWIVQRSGSPLLDFRLDLALDVWALAVDVILALGVDANATKAGVGAWEVGDAFSLDCLRTALRIQDARFDWIYVNYTRTPVDVVASTFAARRGGDLNYDLEDDVAATIIPATVDLIEHGFWDFSHCAVDEFVRTDGRYAAGSSVASYDDEPDAVSGTARDRFRQRVARDDDHLIVVAKEAEAVRISVMATTLRSTTFYRGRGSFPGESHALPRRRERPRDPSALQPRRGPRGLRRAAGLDRGPVGGLSVDAESPLGDASIAFNVTFERVRLDDFEVEAWVDGSSLNALSGDDLGLGEVFVGGLVEPRVPRGVAGGRPRRRRAEAPRRVRPGPGLSDRENIDGVVESAVQSAAFLIGEYADAADMRTELVWLFNDVLDARLADVKDACVAQRPGAPVADRRDVRGERPTARARRDAEGFHGGLKLTYEMLTVVGLLASMFLSFGLIWAKRRARPAVRRALRKRARDPKPSADGLAVPGLRDAAFDDEAKAASDDDVLADRDGSFVVEEAVGDATANDELGGYRRPRRPSLIAEAPLPRPLKALLLLVMVCNTGFGAWPYLEIFLLIWGYTRSGLDPRTREKVWRTVEMLSKWSFIDVFTVVFLVVAFYVHAPIDAPGASFDFETFVEMRTGFYAFCVATLTSMALGQVVLYLHREVHHYGRRFGDESDRVHDARSLPKGAPAAADGDDGVHDARSLPEGAPAAADGDDDAASDGSSDGGDRADEELASLKTSIVEMLTPEDRSVDDDDIFPRMEPVAAAARRAPLRSHRYKGRRPRWWQAAVAPLFAGVFAMLAYAFTVDVIRFEVGGAAGFLIDETRTGEATRDYSAAGAIFALRGCTPEDGWRPLVRFLTWVSAIFAFLIPLAHCSKLLAAADVLYGWSSLDVFVVSVVAAATQFGDVATSLAKDECKDVDGLLATFFDSTLGDDASCFTLALEVLDGCFLLTLACLFHMVAGHLAGNVTAAAVAERLEEAAATAEAPAPPPRSALELVAQKDGDVAI
ncbi:paraquat-inducible protein A [Aureococcus anophagefferens]|nr:paraquat-inducible protein A [Aureococcus anophagefferens]